MKRKWTEQELIRDWSLGSTERGWVSRCNVANRLGFAILLKAFELHGAFPRSRTEVPHEAVGHVARELGVSAEQWGQYPWSGRTFERHRALVREVLGFREATVSDYPGLTRWLVEEVLPEEHGETRVREALLRRCREIRIEPPGQTRLTRIVASAITEFDARFCDATYGVLSECHRSELDALVAQDPRDPSARALLHTLREDPGNVSLKNIRSALERLAIIDEINLPQGLFDDASLRTLQAFHDRSEVEEPYELRRHPDELRYTLLAANCHIRGRQLTDALVDLFIATVHRVGFRAERRVERELVGELKKIVGKNRILFSMAEASLASPDDLVREVIFPVVSEQTLYELVREWKSKGSFYREKVLVAIRGSYRAHYRRMLTALLSRLDFRSNNESHRELIRAIELIRRYADSRRKVFVIQEILADPEWMEMLTKVDLRALTPLLYLHVTPYGSFRLDLHERLPIGEAVA